MNKPNMLWGVSGHNKNYQAYPERNLEQQISLSAELGVNIYRLNFTPDFNSTQDIAYLDKVISLCEKYKLKLFLIIFDRKLTENEPTEFFYDYAKKLAQKYKGIIPYYQLSNEQDNQCLIEDSTGEARRNYDVNYTFAVAEKLKALGDGIKASDPKAKVSINISYKHTYFLTLLLEYGVSWDISGLDWYSNMGDPDPTMGNLLALPATEIFVSEINTWGGNSQVTALEQADYFEKMINYFKKFERVTAFMPYELLDEPTQEGLERFFGLIECDENGNVGAKKPIFNTLIELFKN